MRMANRAVETRPVGVDPPPRPRASRSTQLESRGRRASRDQMLRRGRLGLAGQSLRRSHSHRLEGRNPFRTPGKIDKPLR